MKSSAPTSALIFDMDGTMIDSMPWHQKSWVEFCKLQGIDMDVADLMRRTTSRNGAECMAELFGSALSHEESWELVRVKEELYRDMFSPVFAEVAGFKTFAGQAVAQGLKLGVDTAGDKHNIAFAFKHLAMQPQPLAVVGGDEGLPGKPEPAIFLEAARRMGVPPEQCIVFEDAPFGIEAARRAGMRAVAVCTTHSPAELAGPHVLASVRNYHELMDQQFLGTLHAIT